MTTNDESGRTPTSLQRSSETAKASTTWTAFVALDSTPQIGILEERSPPTEELIGNTWGSTWRAGAVSVLHFSKCGNGMAQALEHSAIHLAQDALLTSPVHELRKLVVERQDDRLLITGNVHSFYHKQLAQEAIRLVCGKIELMNQIDVAEFESDWNPED
jgi:hypothetical protein